MTDRKDWMQVWPSAGAYWPTAPAAEDLRLADMVWALSLGTRYNGHVRRRYSVLEHEVRMCWILRRRGHSEAVQFQALMHDMPEAYVTDLPRAVKKAVGHEFTHLEEMSWRLTCERWGVQYEIFPAVKQLDGAMCHEERRHLCPGGIAWHVDIEAAIPKMRFLGRMPPVFWRWAFMREFNRLYKGAA